MAEQGGLTVNLDERIRAAVLPVVPVCEPDFYEGDAEIYCTFNVNEMPTSFGDDAPRHMRCFVQLHLFAPGWPKPPSTRSLRRELCRAVLAAGFTYPEVTDASEKETQHYVLEFEGVEEA